MKWLRTAHLGSRAAKRRRVAQGTVVALVAGLLTVLAINHDGSPINDVELNDGGVWVTNRNLQMMARLNSQVKELDMGILTSATSDEVFQEGASVQVFDDGGGNAERALRIANPVTGTATPVTVPDTFVASAARDTVAITDTATGRVWIRRADQLTGFTENTPSDLEVSPRSALVVSRSGTALIADRRAGTVTGYRLDTAGLPVEQDSFDFDTEFTDDVVLTAVGDVPVALQEGTLLRPGEDPVEVAGDNPALQEVGPEAQYVHVATDDGLWRGKLSGGDLEDRTVVDAGGFAAPPVMVGDCVHAAWAVPAQDNYQRQCGEEEPFVAEIKPLSETGELVFRTNRDVVVINDVAAGGAWLVEQEGLTRVDNWRSVNPNESDPQVAEASDEKSNTKRNKPPQAKDDTFGARPGATVVLPVTLNDVDADGDILTLTKPPASNRQASFSVTGGGTQVQARIAPNAEGTISFDYEISDGRAANPPSEATVNLRLFGDDVDKAPGLIEGQKNELEVAAGHAASTNVLPAWIDPEGDSVVLVAASSDGGEVGFRPDGTIDFRDSGEGPGRKTIDFVVQGGAATAEGSVEIRVLDPEKARPVVVADRFTGPVGSTILLEPLANDTDPLGGQLTVPRLQRVAGGAANVAKDDDRGTATFRSDRHGSYYLEYEAVSSNGQMSETTVIRVDVVPRSGNNRPPVATRDVAAVQSDGSVLVDVLANDIDPDGDVMVVQGVQVPPEWQDTVTASLINKRFVRVEVTGDLDDSQPEFEYLLSDGESDQVTGTVSVVLAEELENRPPVAREDLVTVRAGTIVTIPVTDNDEDPDADPLSVHQQDLFDVDRNRRWVEDGEAPIVATGSGIRVMVPDDGTTQMQVGYGVRDSRQARADSRLVLNIKPDDPENNRGPEPRPIEDRTVAGQRIRVPVDLFGADPDGDPVVFTGVVEPPRFGRIVKAGAGWFEYEPFEDEKSTGTDEFKVLVTDPYGASGTVDVRIGVAPRSRVNQSPAALDDRLLVKPGLTIQYPVMQNDSDPDGDPLILEEGKLSAPNNVDAKVVDQFVEMKVPSLGKRSEANVGALYSVTDGLGSSSTALLTVTAREDAPDHAPIAADDVVTAEQMAGKRAGDTVDVDVLDNDGDLDGSKDALVLEAVEGEGAEVVDGELRVTLEADGRVVPYKITDATEQRSFGFVYVAGTSNMPPQLNTAAVPVEAVAGEEEAIDLDEVVVVRDGRSPKVARTDQITTTNGDTRADGLESLVFRAPPAYHGPASVTLGVIDGEDLNDPTGLESQITIPITVLPADNVPPEVRSTSVVVYAGGVGKTVDLDRLATDVNDDDLAFEVEGARDGVEATIEDGMLHVAAADDASNGEVELSVRASDGTADAQVGHVHVTVIGGTDAEEAAPPMQLVDIRIADGVAGEPEQIDVRDAIASDPFPDQSKKVTWVSPPALAKAAGSTITVTPDSAGELVVTYRLDDGSGDSAREVEGRIIIVVADVPEAPGPPTAVEGGPDSVQLTWRAPDDQGSPITHYIVRWNGGEQECRATQCTVEGLDPGEQYTFTVAAVNQVAKNGGEGPESPPSAPVTPDTVPETMTAPVVSEDDYADRDGKLHLSWTPPRNEGSDIQRYELESQPATRSVTVGPDDTEFTWEGLTNGTSYRFLIRAVNGDGEADWSPPSEAHSPFTRPLQMAPPELVSAGNDDGSGNGYLEVSWPEPQAPANGHDEVLSYEVQLYKGESLLRTKPATTTSTDFTVPNGSSYTAKVRATNRAGWSDWSGKSVPQITYDASKPVTGIAKESDCEGCATSTTSYKGRVKFKTPTDNGGYPVTEYRYETEDGRTGTWSQLDDRKGAWVYPPLPFRSNQQNQWVRITPITSPPDQGEVVGGTAQGGDFDPYAKPFVTRMSWISGYRKVGATWTCDGNGRPVKSLTVIYAGRREGQKVNGTKCSEPYTESPVEGGDYRCFRSYITTIAGDSATNDHGCRQADPLTGTVQHGDRAPNVGGCDNVCKYVDVSVSGLLEGSYRMTAYADGSGPAACEGNFGGTDKYINVGSGGHGRNRQAWRIETECYGTKVTVTVYGKRSNFKGSFTIPR